MADYPSGEGLPVNEAGLFAFTTPNLGDDMQSFAVLAHLDRVHTFVDRDRLPDFNSKFDTTCVFNCWFLIGQDGRKPADVIKPIWHGFAGWKESLPGEWMGYIRSHSQFSGPIGCRDLYTTEQLGEAGINAYWSGCLTLFLGRMLSQPVAQRKGVYFVDLPAAAEEHIPAELVRRAIRISTFPPPGMLNHTLERWATVGRLAKILSEAELVVTRRLHVALPAASFGTPVVAVPDPGISLARRRFAGFETILPTVYLDDLDAGMKKIDWLHVPPVRIPEEMNRHHAALNEQLQARQLAGGPARPESPLDCVGSQRQFLTNLPKVKHPGKLRLRLRDRCFDLPVQFWSDTLIEVALRGFPGLSKFQFQVEVGESGREAWTSWGLLRDLVQSPPPD